MLDDLFAYALTAVVVLGLAAFMRQRGWGIALPLIALGVVVGLAPFGPTAPPEPEVILILLLAPLVFGEALSSSYLDLRRVSRPVLAPPLSARQRSWTGLSPLWRRLLSTAIRSFRWIRARPA